MAYPILLYVVGYNLRIWCLNLRLSVCLSFFYSFFSFFFFFLLIDFEQTHGHLGWSLVEKSFVTEW